MKVTIEGYTTLTGRPEAILRMMRDANIFEPEMSADDYIDGIQRTVWRCFGIGLNVHGETTAERAEHLLAAMGAAGLIKIEEE